MRSVGGNTGHILVGVKGLDACRFGLGAAEQELVLAVSLHGVDGTDNADKIPIIVGVDPDIDRIAVAAENAFHESVVEWIDDVKVA